MPNQRAEDKKQFTAAVNRKKLDELDVFAKQLDKSRTALLDEAISRFLEALKAQQASEETK